MTTTHQDTTDALARLTGRFLARTVFRPVGFLLGKAFSRYLKKNADHFTKLDRATLESIAKLSHDDGARAARELIHWLDHFESRKNRA